MDQPPAENHFIGTDNRHDVHHMNPVKNIPPMQEDYILGEEHGHWLPNSNEKVSATRHDDGVVYGDEEEDEGESIG